MPRRPISRRIQSADRRLRWTTIRDFGGGLNVIDNDQNLSSRFASVLTNVVRGPDGSNQIRWGTREFSDTSIGDSDVVTFTSDAVTIETFNTSNVIELDNITTKTFVRGQRIRIADLTLTYGGIAAANINGDRLITAIAAGSLSGQKLSVQVGAAASSSTGPTVLGEGTYSKEVAIVDSDVVAQRYFDDHIVTVHANGEMSRTNALGQAEVIWNDDIASLLPGAPSGWSASTFSTFAVFGGVVSGGALAGGLLYVDNGIDKMVQIDFTNPAFAFVQYTLDSGGSSTATPIGRYIESLPEFLVVAGVPTSPSALLVSDQRNATEWVLADGTTSAVPGQATAFDLVHYINVSNPIIRGIRRFADRLVVAFDEAVVLVTITAGSTNAEISVDKVVEKQGAIANNSMVSIGDDILMADVVGVNSLQQALFTGGVRTERPSQLIDPDIQELIKDLSIGESEDRIFAVFNPLESQYMLFVPNDALTETIGFTYTKIDSLRIAAWARVEGVNWRSGSVSTLGRVFFSEGKILYILGTRHDPIYSDKEAAGAGSGTAITFRWDLPWADFDQRALIKKTKFIKLETKGAATFTVNMFVDNTLVDQDGNDAPSLTLDFIGGSSGGYGAGPQPYGGGRRTSDERLWGWTTKFIIAKLQLVGTTTAELKFISISLGYQLGSIRR